MRKHLTTLAILTAIVLSLSAHAATFMTVTGTKQGAFKGEGAGRDHKDAITVLNFSLEMESPRDAATGQASGKRIHKPLLITKELDGSSPQFFEAMVNNETLSKVTLEMVKPSNTGAEVTYYKITLTNASVASIKDTTPTEPATPRAANNNLPIEEIALTYQKIEVESVTSKTTATDNWQTR